MLARFQVPVDHVTCLALGGSAGDRLLVMTAREGLSTADLMAKPLSGSRFGMAVAPGLYLPEALFNDA